MRHELVPEGKVGVARFRGVGARRARRGAKLRRGQSLENLPRLRKVAASDGGPEPCQTMLVTVGRYLPARKIPRVDLSAETKAGPQFWE